MFHCLSALRVIESITPDLERLVDKVRSESRFHPRCHLTQCLNTRKPLKLKLDAETVSDVSTGGLRGAHDFHNLASLHSEITRHWVAGEDPRELVLFDAVAV